MPRLAPPTVAVHRSFLAAMAEFRAEGRGGPDDGTVIGHDHRTYGDTWSTEEGFAAYVADLLAQPREDAPRPEGWVPSTTLWLVERDEYLGRVQLRHRLTDYLLRAGGHIGYDVRSSARRRGHATRMLQEILPLAHGLGIESVLVICASDNVGSRRVIENSHGVLEDEREGRLRFWVPTSRAQRS
jgi:predicted acetyltransferase